jgi:glutamate dehydrogenase
MPVELPGREDESAPHCLIEQANALLHKSAPAVPPNFAAQLFARVGAEDLTPYSAAELAGLAGRAWQFLSERPTGAAKVRVETLALDGKAVTVLETVNDDMPFLLDSVMGELTERKLEVRLVAHPVFGVTREGGRLAAFGAPGAAGSARESFIHIHIEPAASQAGCAEIAHAIEVVLGEVQLAVTDWRATIERVQAIAAELKSNPPPLPVEETGEAIQFLYWLVADHFTFLGLRDYTFDGSVLVPDYDNALGIMRSRELRVLRRGTELLEYTPEIMAFLKEPRPLIVAKANVHSRVHRRTYLDYVGIKRFDEAGNLVGEQRIVGLFTSTAYTSPARTVPYLRRKIATVEARAGFARDSHSGKALAAVLEHYPRDELFQIDEDTLYHFALAIMHLGERPRVRVLLRHDRFDRFFSVLVFVPRERYDSDARVKIGDMLAAALAGRVSAYYPFFPEGPLVRVHFIIGRSGGPPQQVDRTALEDAVEAIVRTWSDGLDEALALTYAPDDARGLFARYARAFSEGFHEDYPPSIAAGDIRTVEGLSEQHPLAVDFHHRDAEEPQNVGLKIWSLDRPLPLSERVPVLENMGFAVVDERTYHVAPEGHAPVWFHDMLLTRADREAVALSGMKAELEAAFVAVMRGAAENDGYFALTLHAGMAWRDVALIRTLSRFLRQARVPFSQDYMWATLVKHAGIARDIVALFHARFDPTADNREVAQKDIAARIEDELQKVESLDEDRILRRFVNAVQTAIRTNFYQTGPDGQPKPLIAV